MSTSQTLIALMLSIAAGAAAAAPHSSTVDFSNGREEFQGIVPTDGSPGGTVIDTTLGNGAPAMRSTLVDSWGVYWGTSTNQAFVGDYSGLGSVTLGLDVSTQSITFRGDEVTRDLVVELRDYDNNSGSLPFTSVWYKLGTLDASKAGWQHLSVTIADTASSLLPAGWGGYGAEDASGPVLPADRTFASVLAGVDEIVFTTMVPGHVYGYTNFDVAIDNISIAAVPEPSTYGMLLGGLGLVGWMSRRKLRGATAGAPAAA